MGSPFSSIVRYGRVSVKYNMKQKFAFEVTMVKLILRDQEFEVKPGMTLLSSLEKCGILSESVIASREGELILDDEILKNGDVVKLISVISGGAGT